MFDTTNEGCDPRVGVVAVSRTLPRTKAGEPEIFQGSSKKALGNPSEPVDSGDARALARTAALSCVRKVAICAKAPAVGLAFIKVRDIVVKPRECSGLAPPRKAGPGFYASFQSTN